MKKAHVKNKVEQFRKYYLRVFTKYDTMKELLDLILPGDVLAFFEVVKVSTTDQPENLCFFHVMRKFCTV